MHLKYTPKATIRLNKQAKFFSFAQKQSVHNKEQQFVKTTSNQLVIYLHSNKICPSFKSKTILTKRITPPLNCRHFLTIFGRCHVIDLLKCTVKRNRITHATLRSYRGNGVLRMLQQ